MSFSLACTLLLLFFACAHKDAPDVTPTVARIDSTKIPKPVPFSIDQIADTYGQIADPSFSSQWGPYNVHDPCVIQEGEYFYSYSTDVAYGATVRPGLQVRRSKDLVEWVFRGWVFPVLPFRGVEFIKQNGGEPNNGLWAPCVVKVGNTFRLYYSLASSKPRLSVIGMATSSSPDGPWNEQPLVVTSLNNNSVQTNAIDPAVIVDKSGTHWMYYGSAWDGIYILKLDAATGLAATPDDKGVRIAQRGFTGTKINGNIEGPDIIHNEDLNKYYLFIAYDWLETKYNVRVGRANSPQGPFLDYLGNDLNNAVDHVPMIVAPYRFGNHQGWQGTAHCSVFKYAGKYFMAHQGRPGENQFYMVMHVRQVFWTEDGWPVVSPERYAAIENEPVSIQEVTGGWDRIVLRYGVVPGFSESQISPDMQRSIPFSLDANGTIDGDAASTWTYTYPQLFLSWKDGNHDHLIVHRGRDWENKVKSTILFTGIDLYGTSVWGKKN